MNELVRRSTEVAPVDRDPFHKLIDAQNNLWRLLRLVNANEDWRTAELTAALDAVDAAEDMARLVLTDTCPATRREIAERLAALSGAIPNGNRVDPEAYGKMLTIEVTATRPSKAALSAACRELIRTAHWLPSIAEVLQAIREAEQAVQMRQRYLDSLPRLKAAAVARIKGERVALTDEERKTREKQARLEANLREIAPAMARLRESYKRSGQSATEEEFRETERRLGEKVRAFDQHPGRVVHTALSFAKHDGDGLPARPSDLIERNWPPP